MAFMEGPLSKWTNVMKGWQYRWFVLDENSGLLSYYTSKEKMMRGARRGCVRLLGAVIGIDDEDDSTFTITVDQKTFHFQARDAEEKEKWIEALENTIARHSLVASVQVESKPVPTMADFDKKLAQTDAYLQLLIDQVQALETRIDECPDETARQKYNVIKLTAESTIESIKQSIVIMQISKQNVCCDSPLINGPSFESLNEDHITLEVPSYKHSQGTSGSTTASEDSLNVDIPLSNPVMSAPMLVPSPLPASPLRGSTSLTSSNQVPDMSYSSSDDEDFFDAEEGAPSSASSHSQKVNGETDNPCDVADGDTPPPTPPVVIASKDDYFDELYDNVDDDELDSLDKHGSIITHLLSQVRIGMDLTKIVLPTFILEKRSLLEMYADFLAHPDLFVSITDHETPEARMVQTVRWYMSAFHAGRRSTVAKKPYNPILGETFLCHYDLPNEEPSAELVEDGPVKGATKNNVAFIAEQVSHHPPISAFYAEHYNKGISLDGYIWTKSKFLGLSIGVHMIGQAVVNLQKYDEDYTFTFPNGYGRSILTVPWVELGGKTQINCAKTGYYANVEFHTKPFYGGKKDRVTAEIFAPNEKKPFCTVQGEWNGVMYAKYTSGFNEVFVDTKNMPIIKKRVKPLDQQIEYESRRLWKDVTKSLKEKNVEQATAAKHFLEQRQREEAKDRKERKAKWETKHFQEVGEHWVYLEPLVNRLQSTPTSTTTATPCITPTSTEDNIINNNASNNNNNNNQLS